MHSFAAEFSTMPWASAAMNEPFGFVSTSCSYYSAYSVECRILSLIRLVVLNCRGILPLATLILAVLKDDFTVDQNISRPGNRLLLLSAALTCGLKTVPLSVGVIMPPHVSRHRNQAPKFTLYFGLVTTVNICPGAILAPSFGTQPYN